MRTMGDAGAGMIEFLGPIAPAGTPKPIIEQIAKATRTVVAERAYQHMLIESGLEPTLDSNPEKFRRSRYRAPSRRVPARDRRGMDPATRLGQSTGHPPHARIGDT
jgi:hypothetical protein